MDLHIKKFITFFYTFFNRASKKRGLRALKYHSITDSKSPNDLWTLNKDFFKEHLEYIKGTKRRVYSLEEIEKDLPADGIVITFDDGYEDNLIVAAPILYEFEMPFSIFIITDYVKKSNNYLNEVLLKELSNNPLVSIGSHSKSHAKLTNCSLGEVKREIRDSKSYLEDLLGERVTAFSYPHGKFNSLVKNEVLEAGYSLAFTSHYDINQIDQDKLALNTNEIWNSDNLFCFIKKMKGDWDWLKFRNL